MSAFNGTLHRFWTHKVSRELVRQTASNNPLMQAAFLGKIRSLNYPGILAQITGVPAQMTSGALLVVTYTHMH